MKVETVRFGTLEVDDDQIFTFPMGLLGFANHKEFLIIDHTHESPFKWMQSCEDPELAFILTDPLFFRADYHIAARKGELQIISPTDAVDLVVSVIMTVPDDPKDMSANLLAPLVFNMANRLGMQYVLTNNRYPVKYYVMREKDPSVPAPTGNVEPRSISLR